MSAELIINASAYETRVALVENGQVAELYIERASDRGIAGNICKGRVVRVLPGMQAAFVDIGMEKAAFLYVSDVRPPMEDLEQALVESCEIEETPEEEEDLQERLGGHDDAEPAEADIGTTAHPSYLEVPIEDRLQEGQDILVQVAKEPIGNKGARITTHITLPGRHLVLMPLMNHVGVSRRIENEKERKRLREIVCAIQPPNCGLIVRTAAEGAEPEKLQAEMDFLMKLWQSIEHRAEYASVG